MALKRFERRKTIKRKVHAAVGDPGFSLNTIMTSPKIQMYMYIKFRITRYNESRLQRVKKCKGKYSFKAGVHWHQTFQQCQKIHIVVNGYFW